MAVVGYFACFVAIFVQVVTCQGIGNLNTGFNNGLFGANFMNGLTGPGLVGPGLADPGLAGPGLVSPGLGGLGLGGSGLVGNGLIGPNFGSPGLMGSSLGGPGLGGCGLGTAGLGGPGLGSGLAGTGRPTGGSFAVTSSSPIAPTGVSILAENLSIEGPLSVGGQLPFLGTVGLEGNLPATGSGTVSYGCGTGNIGITSDIGSPYGLVGAYGPAVASQYGAGLGQGANLGPSFAGNLAGYNSGLGAGFSGPGLSGPGCIGNGLAARSGGNLAGSGLGVTGAKF